MTERVIFGLPVIKGIPFEYDGGQQIEGRRVVTHLYPYWDRHLNDRLGRKPRRWRVRGVFSGESFRDQVAQARRAWIDDPEPGVFFEPLLGQEHLVEIAEDWVLDLSHTALNFVFFTIELIEASDTVYPSPGRIGRIRAAVDSALAVFEGQYRASGGPQSDVIAGLAEVTTAATPFTRIHEPGFWPDFVP